MGFLLYTIHIVVSLFLILVVLLQQGKGADLSVFGGGATMTAFGARGAASLLHRFTVGGFVVFIVTTLAIGVYQTKGSDSVAGGLPSAEEAAAAAEDEGDASDAGAGDSSDLTGVLPEAEEFSISPTEGEGTEGDTGDAAGAGEASTDEPGTDTPDTGGSGN